MKSHRKLGRKSLGKIGVQSLNALLAGFFVLGCGTILPMAAEAAETEKASATAEADTGEAPSYSLDEMVVTATRTDTKDLEVPAMVEVYDEKKIEESGAANAFDVLQDTLGVTMQSQGFNGTSMGTMTSKIAIRGVERGTLVLVNGVPMNLDGKYNLEDIPTESIERIEVVKGGGSVLYGSEATGGVINIITKDTFKNKVSVAAGNYGKERYTASFGVDRFNIVLGLENRGSASPMSRPITGAGNGYDYEKGERKSLLWNLKILDGLTFTHAYSKNEHKYLQKNFPVGNITQINDYEDTDNNFFLNYDKDGWKATIAYGTQEKESDYTTAAQPRYRNAWRKGHSTNVNVQKLFNVGRKNKDKLLVGLSYQREDMDLYSAATAGRRPKPALNSSLKRDNYSIYLSYDWMMNDRSNLIVNMRETWAKNIKGERTNLTTGATTQVNDSDISKFTPEIQYIYRPNERSTVYAKVGQSFRMPNLTQLFGTGNILPTLDLKPEQGTHYEVGYKCKDGNRTWRAALFHFQINDAIEADTTNYPEVAYNNVDVRNTGIEVALDIKHNDKISTSWGIVYHNPQQRDNDTYGDNEWHSYYGRYQVKGGVNYKYEKFAATFDLNFIGNRRAQVGDAHGLRPQLFSNMHLSYAPEANQKFFLHLNNLFDRRDITTNGGSTYYTLGRNFMAGYEFTF